jgi:hypothetical protein
VSNESDTPKPGKKSFLSRRQVLLLLGLALINLCLYAGLVLLKIGTESADRPARQRGAEPVELGVAHEQALALARRWQPDVELVGVTTSWQLASGDQLTLQRPAWSFSFYSSTAHQVQAIIVDQSGATHGPQRPVRQAPLSVAADWSLDSRDLLLMLLSYGGEAFMSAHPSANVHLQLKGDSAERSTWYITAVDAASRQSLTVGVDAQSRQVVLNETNAGGG